MVIKTKPKKVNERKETKEDKDEKKRNSRRQEQITGKEERANETKEDKKLD